MLPRETELLGSTASTATLRPASQSRQPRASMKVLFPAPGTPVTPTRIAPPVWGSRRCRISCPRSKCFGALLSIRVMARERIIRSPLSTPSTYSSGVSRLAAAGGGARGDGAAPSLSSTPVITRQANRSSPPSGTQSGL